MSLPGFPGVETLLRTAYTFGAKAGRISWADLRRTLTACPPRMLDLYPRKGALHPGCDADFVIFDADYEEMQKAPVYGRGDLAPYVGLRLGGKVLSTFVRGCEVYSDGKADLGAVRDTSTSQSARRIRRAEVQESIRAGISITYSYGRADRPCI